MPPPTSRVSLNRLLPALAIVLFAAAAAVGLVRLPVFDALDRLAYDAQLRWRSAPLDERIVIVDIDERSLAEQGRWPWPRETIARLSRELTDNAGAAVVGFDIVFAEHERSEAGDGKLAQALRDKPVLLGYYFSSDRGGQRSGVLPAPVFVSGSLPPGVSVTHWDGYGANISQFAHAARDAGFFNPVIDADGVVRSMPMLAEFDGQLYQSLSLALLREYLGEGVLSVGADQLEVIGKRGRVAIPLSEGLTALAPFSGRLDNGEPGLPFRVVSATDVIEGRAPASIFAGRIV
ncbi:MAG: CHASE2 domain-containing protein, partial [Burkholderiaceae bacterium]